ncbi:3-dehydroquinate dehydratase [Halobacteriovorax sp. GB3]|uniref:type II 3-dehydroquinate dehydratase n=1 Tax=Halobacteriovorax sp. GB3 TaxID=2719615 RepID=UPI0023613F0F|nr:type II 3-dehydroquinate dehydratase [Halobacteriovorax sp. GB3]MDD0854596.1 3-dehydroquinate dehydratase [Halobacteriovorax sp. GB3]
MAMKFMVINGPNLNMLGKREASIYGNDSLNDIQDYTESTLSKMGHSVQINWFQSNSETEIIDKIQGLVESDFSALIINPAAYSHTSVAILDALKMLSIPIVEVHLSNTHQRETFRQVKLTAKASTIIMEGLGKNAYLFGILTQLNKGN